MSGSYVAPADETYLYEEPNFEDLFNEEDCTVDEDA
jgi:hypothetical protein